MIEPVAGPFGGRHAETAVLRNVLAAVGIVDPHTGQPFTEAMLLGVGGGIGAAYWVFEYKAFRLAYPILSLGTRHGWGSRTFLVRICDRLGIPVAVKETGAAKSADASLREALADGRPAIAWVDLASLPYRVVPAEWGGAIPHAVGVRGVDRASGQVLIDDGSRVPATLAWETLAAARGRIRASRNRIELADRPSGALDPRDAVEQGIRACCRGMTEAPAELPGWAAGNVGLAGIAKWAELMAHPKDKRGWPTLFAAGLPLYKGLTAMVLWIEAHDTPGGAFRGMYAGFLDEASGPLGKPELRAVAAQYRELGRMWSALAAAALPDTVEPLGRARALMLERKRLFEERGSAAIEEIRGIAGRLDAIQAEMTRAFPLDRAMSLALLADLRDRLRQIHEAEYQALVALQATIAS